MAKTKEEIFASFFDGGKCTAMFTQKSNALSVGVGVVSGNQAVVIAQNNEALDCADMKKWASAIRLAGETGVPVFTFYAASGAMLDGGAAPLIGFSEILKESAKISGVVPQVAVVVGVCGGNSALLAATSDICIMSEEAELFLTPPYTSAAQGDKTSCAGTAKAASVAGVAHIVVENYDAATSAAKKLAEILPPNNMTVTSVFDFAAPTAAFTTSGYTPAKAVAAIADADSICPMFDSFDCSYVALGTVEGSVVGFVATNAEKTLGQKGTAKITRFVRFCDIYNIPVVTVLSTEGFTKSTENDISGGIRNAALLASTYSDATTAKVLVVAGKAVGASYTAFAGCDITVVTDKAVVASIEPTAAATILYADELKSSENIAADTEKYAKVYVEENCSADALNNAGICDIRCTEAELRGVVADALNVLACKRTTRYPKKYGSAL